jgi:hypothetical protein
MYDGILIYPFITTALFYLFARAVITEPLWSRFPLFLHELTQCPACAGAWYGFICGWVGYYFDAPFFGSIRWTAPFIIALMSVVWTPILTALHELAIRAVTNNRIPIAVVIDHRD